MTVDGTDSAGAPHLLVVGGGRMGAGIAHAFLVSGWDVDIRDRTDADADAGRARVEATVREGVARGTMTPPQAEQHLDRLRTAAGLADLGEPVLVVEAVPENLELKLDTWRQLSAGLPQATVLATNTSSLPVGTLADAVRNPSRFIGMHFFNPVPVSALVEVVRARQTSQQTVDRAVTWSQEIGKEPIVVSDSPGFASSRLGLVIGLEAIRMLEDGVASAEDIDRAMTLGYRLPIGPLRLTDVVGLDVRLGIAEHLAATLGERFAPPALLREKVAAGHLGRKSGRGFFDW